MGTNTTYSELDPAYQGQDLRIGIVMSRFNKDICDGLLSACERELLRLGVSKQNILEQGLRVVRAGRRHGAGRRFQVRVGVACQSGSYAIARQRSGH